MLAFHNDRSIKAKYLRRVRAHAKADRLVQGTGWDNGRGCAVGCTLEAYDHSRYSVELGVPVELARLEDRIFESLGKADAMKWPAAFLSAIPVGTDLSMVWPEFAAWMLRGLPTKSLVREDVKAAVAGVLALYDRWIETGVKPAVDEWKKARAVAADAAAYAAVDAAVDADAAADAAAYATAAAAADAAVDAAADAAVGSIARKKFWKDAAKELLRLLRTAQSAPV